MAEIIRDLLDHAKPICPSDDGENPLHRLRVGMLDRFYEAAPKDAEGEFIDEAAGTAYYAAARGDERMDLFYHGASVWQLGRTRVVESWWWRCRVCGFTLPASARP